jgi:hypothetical protein
VEYESIKAARHVLTEVTLILEHLEDLGVNGRIILKCIFKNGMSGRDWIDLDHNTDRRRDLANAVPNLSVP